MFLQCGQTLDPGIRDLADLFRVEVGPLLIVVLLVEGNYVVKRFHINESVAETAHVLEVNGQVEEVEPAPVSGLEEVD